MGEKAAYNHLRKHLPLENTDRFDRVENVVADGFPDINFCFRGREGWIECKAPTEPVRSTTPLFGSNHRVLQTQKNWMLMQQQAGGVAWIYIRTDERAMLIHGKHADSVNELTVNELLNISTWSATLNVKIEEWLLLKRILRTKR